MPGWETANQAEPGLEPPSKSPLPHADKSLTRSSEWSTEPFLSVTGSEKQRDWEFAGIARLGMRGGGRGGAACGGAVPPD